VAGSENVEMIYWVAFFAFLGYAVVYYPVGFVSIFSKKLWLMKWFSYLALFGVLAQMFSAYLHKFNLLIFFLRLLVYIYARFMISLLVGILLLPPN
jgi:hypothetical protein